MAEKLLVSGARLWNMYGPTETTVWSSITEVKPRETRLTIAPTIANTRFYEMDDHLQPVPQGGHGELLIAGSGVALGYFQRERLTAQKFLSDPQFPGERMYRTGDEVRQLADGRLEFIGRLDQQIKLRGYRIELGEIDAAMMACPGVRYAVTVEQKDDSEEGFLIGFYTAEDGAATAPGLLRESMSQRLPAYMIPRHFERLSAFPLTPNGKTDRRALRDYPLTPHHKECAAGSKVASPTEAKLEQMFRKLFPGETIVADSDFFELGGDSLLLVMLQSMFSRKFSLRLDTVDITNHSTIRVLAKWVDDKQAGVLGPAEIPDPRLLPLQKVGTDPPIFILPQMMHFRILAEKLGLEQPVYAIQIKDEDVPDSMDPPSMEDLARLYIGLIRKAQPSGPYRLGGWCLWGWMAYEVARLLEEQGEIVEVLIVIDAIAPGFWDRYSRPRQLLMKTIAFVHRLGWFLVRLWRICFDIQDKERYRRMRTFAVSLAFALPRQWRPEGYVTEVMRIEQVATFAARNYRPSAIKAKVLLFMSEVRPTGRIMGRDMGWESVLKRTVRLQFLPGNHNEILHPQAAGFLAERVRKELGLKPEVVTHS
jgi:thioesterase domain-containing protein/acyl carrier protein